MRILTAILVFSAALCVAPAQAQTLTLRCTIENVQQFILADNAISDAPAMPNSPQSIDVMLNLTDGVFESAGSRGTLRQSPTTFIGLSVIQEGAYGTVEIDRTSGGMRLSAIGPAPSPSDHPATLFGFATASCATLDGATHF